MNEGLQKELILVQRKLMQIRCLRGMWHYLISVIFESGEESTAENRSKTRILLL